LLQDVFVARTFEEAPLPDYSPADTANATKTVEIQLGG